MITAEQLNILITAQNLASREFAVASRDFSAMARTMTRTGRTLTRTLTLPILAIGAAATKTAITFDDEMTKIETLVGVAANQVDRWRESILALGPAVGRGPNELARALFVVTSAGERGANALQVVESAAMAAAIGLGDTATTARAVTAAMQAYKDMGLDAARATDILVGTVRAGNLVAEDLAGSLGRVLATASTLGVTFEEVGGFIATFTRLGVSAEEATTSLRQIFTSILTPQQKTIEALESVNLSATDLMDRLGSEGLLSVLELLMDRFDGNTAALAQVIPNVRALTGVLGTAGAQGEAYAQIVDDLNNNLNTTRIAFDRVKQTPAQQWKVFSAEMQVMFVELGTKLIPTFLSLIDTIRDLVDGWNDMSDSAQGTIIKLTGVAALLGPLALGLGGVMRAFMGLATAVRGAATAVTLFRVATVAEKLAMVGMAAGYAAIAVEIFLIAKAYREAKRDMDTWRDAQERTRDITIEHYELWGEKIRELQRLNTGLFAEFIERSDELKLRGADNIDAWMQAWRELGIQAKLSGGQVVDALDMDYSNLFNWTSALEIGAGELAQVTFNIGTELESAMIPVIHQAAISGEEIGRAIGSGMVSGLRSGDLGQALENTAWMIVQRVISVFVGGLFISSPSKLAIGWGQSVVDGFAIGLSGMNNFGFNPQFGGGSVGAGGAGGGLPAPSAPAGSPVPASIGRGGDTYYINAGFGTEGERLNAGRAARNAGRDALTGEI